MTQQIWVGTRKGLFRVVKNASGWKIDEEVHFLGTQVPMLAQIDDQRLIAALQHGHFGAKMQRSEDGGKTWTEVATPTYPPKPDDVEDIIDPNRNTVIPWSLELIWSLEAASNDTLWCGTLPGGVFTSRDQGDSWELNMPLWSVPNRRQWFGGGYDTPGIHSICVDPRDPQKVAVGISCGGVWMTPDGGVNWECRGDGMRAEYVPPELANNPDIQDPHRMVQCPGSPDHYWVQHHNGIFRSADDCQTWQEISAPEPSGFGFAVAVHPQNPQRAWFVPALRDSDRYPVDGKFVVTRTNDGGQSFEVLTEGLPEQRAYHLVYRHALEVDASGDTLVMGSTTGGLWISEDGGDRWQEVTQDLPPIFVVRFA